MILRADDVRAAYPLFHGEGGGSIPTSALQLSVLPIDMREAMRLNRLWHSALPDTELGTLTNSPHSCAYAAEYQGRWYAVALWSRPINDRLGKDLANLELRRFAIAPDAPRFTASRMLAVMAVLISRRFPAVRRLLSYQATDVHKGTIYRAAGWHPANFSKYSKWGTRRKRKRAAGFIVAPSTRRPPQNVSDKIRWEKLLPAPARETKPGIRKVTEGTQ